MDEMHARAYAAALALVRRGFFSLAILDGKDIDDPLVSSNRCRTDPRFWPITYVANRKADGGVWLVSIAFQDLAHAIDIDPWAGGYQIEGGQYGIGGPTRDVYRFMGIERVWLAERKIYACRRALSNVWRVFVITPYVSPKPAAWAAVAAAIAKLTP